MRDLLPDVSIAISNTTPREFMDRMAELAVKSGLLVPDKKYNFDEILKMVILNFHVEPDQTHKGLLGQLIHTPKLGKRIRVKVKLNQCHSNDELSYETYVDAINFIFCNLLSEYNRTYGERYRLNIQKKEAAEPKLSPKAQEEFNTFVALANKNGLHPLDWERFYRFSRVCHVFHTKTNDDDVFRILVHAEFPEDYARELATIFGHLRDFQRCI